MAHLSRKLLISGNLLLTLMLVGVLFIMINWVASRRYARWDLTQRKITALSPKTLQALHALPDPVSVVVFYQPSHRLYELVKDELEEYARLSPNMKVEFVDPEQDIARAKQLAQQLQIDDLNLVVFQSGARHKYLSDTELADYDYSAVSLGGQPTVKAFKGEEAFTSAILSVTQAKSPLVWFTSGHGETRLETADPQGFSELKKYLQQQNLLLETVPLLERSSIPPDVALIVISGPTRRFTETELALLQGYLDHGGRLLALIDPLTETGLDGLLERWGVNLGLDIVVDPDRQLPFVSAANLLVTTYTQHPIVEKMKTLVTLFPLARSVRPTEPVPQGLTVTSLALTSDTGWGETQTSTKPFKFDQGKDAKGPVSLAAASERLPTASTLLQAGMAPARTRLVVIGDSDFVRNEQLPNVGNKDFLLGSIFWLTEQERLIGIGPKPIESIRLSLTGSQLTGVFWFSLLGFPMAFGALGTIMWFLRRT